MTELEKVLYKSEDSMKILGRTFSGKVMVFGEYSVISGSSVAILPYKQVTGYLAMPDEAELDIKAMDSNKELRGFLDYLYLIEKKGAGIFLNLSQIHKDLENGMFFHSTIPQKYGLGSSGAVCAALFEYYKRDGMDWKTMPIVRVKTLLARMESYFHGSSSGVDPLSIYFGEPLFICNGDYIRPGAQGAFSGNKMRIFMIDTMQPGETITNMIYFEEQMKIDSFQQSFTYQFVPLVNRTIEEWMKGSLKENTIFALSREQLRFLRPMVPPTYDEIWMKGIYTGMFALKMCGSGGGGKILGFTEDIEETRDYLWNKYCVSLETL